MTSKFLRWQEVSIARALKDWRVVLLVGARQVGKTDLAKKFLNSLKAQSVQYFTLDDQTVQDAAGQDPKGFVAHANTLLIIDEIQRSLDLVLAIKLDVDNDNRPGRFLLTGSADIMKMAKTKDSLAGRVKTIRLRPLSVGERKGRTPNFISKIFTHKLSKANLENTRDKDDKNSYIAYALKGGFPEAIARKSVRRQHEWHRAYIDSILNNDLKEITDIRRHGDMARMPTIFAECSSQTANIDRLTSLLSISRPTFNSYTSSFEKLFLIEWVDAWGSTNYARVGKQRKLFMTDSGLMASLLGWEAKTFTRDPKPSGKLLETFAFTELSALIECQTDPYRLTHYRDREGREIDFIIEKGGKKDMLVGIEIKAGSAIEVADFKHIKWFAKNLAKPRPFRGIILYTGEHILSFGDDCWAVPFNCMWG